MAESSEIFQRKEGGPGLGGNARRYECDRRRGLENHIGAGGNPGAEGEAGGEILERAAEIAGSEVARGCARGDRV